MAEPRHDARPTPDAPPGRSRDFAYVGGAPTPRPSGHPETPLDVLVEAVGILVDQQRRPPYRCRVVSQSGTTVQQHEARRASARRLLRVHRPRDRSRRLVGRGLAGADRRRRAPGDARARVPSVPRAARLAFPLQLPIWGRRNQYRMTGATRRDREIIVESTHVDDPHLRGTLTVDIGRLLVTRLDAMGDLLHRMEVEPERWLVD
ncbi:hypothetical protein [Clavibacter tessellarius]|uniref:hypothetical protein n=1 Tax=Clavibacter tessellarius TaxID=31965 RepID=UPI003253A5B4